jgi:hypothetical protein
MTKHVTDQLIEVISAAITKKNEIEKEVYEKCEEIVSDLASM